MSPGARSQWQFRCGTSTRYAYEKRKLLRPEVPVGQSDSQPDDDLSCGGGGAKRLQAQRLLAGSHLGH
eukprot:COSAG06_NODE_24834_length_651_cov_1.192029_1_plen_67_part_10